MSSRGLSGSCVSGLQSADDDGQPERGLTWCTAGRRPGGKDLLSSVAGSIPARRASQVARLEVLSLELDRVLIGWDEYWLPELHDLLYQVFAGPRLSE